MPRGSKPGERRGGRHRGTPNKVTESTRVNFGVLLSNNMDRMQGWLDHVAKEDPLAALRVVTDWAEFSVPKLARTELVGGDGGPVLTRVIHEEADADQR